MAVSPKLIVNYNLKRITDLEEAIDRELQDFALRGSCVNNTKSFTLNYDSALTESERQELMRRYRHAGWSDVQISIDTSDDTRPGMVTIKLCV